jgi:tetratricopeptide (TPR) repeat protein
LLTQDQAQNKNQFLAKGREKFNRAIDLKQDYALVYLQKALLERMQGNANDESDALLNAQKYSTSDATIALQVGLVYFQDGKWQSAQGEFQRALSIAPNYAYALYYDGLVNAQLGQKDAAITEFSKLLLSNPGNDTIKKIMDNIRAGKSALDGLGPQPAPPNPSTTTPPLPASNTASPKLPAPTSAKPIIPKK